MRVQIRIRALTEPFLQARHYLAPSRSCSQHRASPLTWNKRQMPIKFDTITLHNKPKPQHSSQLHYSSYSKHRSYGSSLARFLCNANTALHCPTSYPGNDYIRNSFPQLNNIVHWSTLFVSYLKQKLSQPRLHFSATTTFLALYCLKKHPQHQLSCTQK
jgi:hypothetical protein